MSIMVWKKQPALQSSAWSSIVFGSHPGFCHNAGHESFQWCLQTANSKFPAAVQQENFHNM